MIARRKFLLDCSTAVAAFALMPAWLNPRKARSTISALPGDLSYSAFAAQINSNFRVRVPSGRAVNLQLIKARLVPSSPVARGVRPPPDAHNEKFSLMFTGPQDSPLPAAIHYFEHPYLGRSEMYIGEVGARGPGGIRYEAVFNRPGNKVLQHTSMI